MNGDASRAAGARASYDGEAVAALATQLGAPAVHAYGEVGSTMDLAHAAAANGAAAGTVIVADVQTAGRGRNGRRWLSDAEAGVWATVVERPRDVTSLSVLSLRVGLALAAELERLLSRGTTLKWPNDVQLEGRKLAGVLVEARWRDGAPEWAAIGVGVNRKPPAELPDAIGTGDALRRSALLGAVVQAVRTASTATGLLTDAEIAAWDARDVVRGRVVVSPVRGAADGVNAAGELLIRTSDGAVRAVPTATVQYAELATTRE
ncbi:MAG TPA: biotin--[acetyl-CoA-carboxylase] ligase [Gemmatirosa sp.]